MLFLGPIYNWIANRMAASVNHWPLIRLIMYSLDKTILYALIFLVVRFVWLRVRRRPVNWGHELAIFVFTAYLILLLALTVFRGPEIYFPWNLHPEWGRSFASVNTVPLVGSLRLFSAHSRLDFYYQTFGNVLWFMPLGLLWPVLGQRGHRFWGTAILSIGLSLGIECWQFLLMTGIADVNDVIFNFVGGMLGYCIYRLVRLIIRHH